MLVDFDILTVIIGFVVFAIIAIIFKLRLKKDNIYILFCFIMFLYFLNVAKFTLFPFPVFSDWYEPNLLESINLVPFNNILTRESLLNIIMMIPFGFGLPFISKVNKWKKIIIAAFISGLFIEFLQFIIGLTFSKGFTFRFIDIDDVICNFVGTIIGFYCLTIVSKLYLKLLKNNNFDLNQFWNYIFNVADTVNGSNPSLNKTVGHLGDDNKF